MYLSDGYYQSLKRDKKADENKFLEQYFVAMVRADAVHCWACEQIKSVVLTADNLMTQLMNIFADKDEAMARDKKKAYTWRDYWKYGNKMQDIFAAIVESNNEFWKTYTKEQILWFHFRGWFFNKRMTDCIVSRAKLAISSFEFYKEPQSLAETPIYDKMHNPGDLYKALKTLEEVQYKTRSRHKYGYGDGYGYGYVHGGRADDEYIRNNAGDKATMNEVSRQIPAEPATSASECKYTDDRNDGNTGRPAVVCYDNLEYSDEESDDNNMEYSDEETNDNNVNADDDDMEICSLATSYCKI